MVIRARSGFEVSGGVDCPPRLRHSKRAHLAQGGGGRCANSPCLNLGGSVHCERPRESKKSRNLLIKYGEPAGTRTQGPRLKRSKNQNINGLILRRFPRFIFAIAALMGFY